LAAPEPTGAATFLLEQPLAMTIQLELVAELRQQRCTSGTRDYFCTRKVNLPCAVWPSAERTRHATV